MMQEPLTLNEFPSANVNKSTSFPSHSYMKDFSQLLRSTGGKKKNSNQTKVAAIFTSATIALLAIVALVVHSVRLYHTRNGTGNGTGTGTNVNYRFLENDENDYSQYMCDDIFIYTESNSEARCYFAQSCNSSQGLFASFIFCNTWNLSLSTWCYILTPLFTIWLVILFRMLGSTAEEFFSPSLEMFSMKMGLPPRFAGVTLLALGNGAADVSATISAIAQNPQEGYQMSLGALTGAGMFVGTVVAGVVIVIADGVKCRGALVRDLGMFVITLAVVYAIFDRGEIGVGAIHIFFWLYLGFVVVVLVADIYHRAVVLPRIRNEQSEVMAEEDEAASEERESAAAAAAAAASSPEQRVQFDLNTFDGNMSSTAGIELATARTSSTDVFHTPLNSGLEENDTFQDNAGMDHNSPTPPLRSEKTTNSKSTKKRGTFRRGFDRFMVAFSNYGPNEGMTDVNPANEQANNTGWSGGLEVNGERNDEHVRLHGARGLLTRRASVEEEEEQQDGDQRGQREFTAATSYRALMEGVDNMCTIDGSLSSGMGVSWGNAFATAKQEIGAHFSDYNDDIWENGENSVFDKFFMTLELPFTIMRKVSVLCLKYVLSFKECTNE
jgi:Ca2+/Na+ antiporter